MKKKMSLKVEDLEERIAPTLILPGAADGNPGNGGEVLVDGNANVPAPPPGSNAAVMPNVLPGPWGALGDGGPADHAAVDHRI